MIVGIEAKPFGIVVILEIPQKNDLSVGGNTVSMGQAMKLPTPPPVKVKPPPIKLRVFETRKERIC